MTKTTFNAVIRTRTKALSLVALAGTLMMPLAATPAHAQSDMSPVLLLESMPASEPGYRRKVRVHYLNGSNVNVSYQALNRSEFTQVPGTADPQLAASCASGPSTTLNEIKSFNRAEKQRARRGEAPETVRFCIKGVPSWKARNQKEWLDPIFDGMPYAAALK